MPYPFPHDIQQRVQAQLDSGQFRSEDEVIREAIETLERRQFGLRQLRGMVDTAEQDVAADRIEPFDAEATKVAVREQLRQRGVTD